MLQWLHLVSFLGIKNAHIEIAMQTLYLPAAFQSVLPA